MVGTSGGQGQLVVSAIALYRKGLCLRVAAKTAVDNICVALICWASPEVQRVRIALLQIEERTKMKVEHFKPRAKSALVLISEVQNE